MTGPDLRLWRQGQNMTQAEAAKRLGISRNALVKYENSPHDIPRVVRLAIIGAEQEMQTT